VKSIRDGPIRAEVTDVIDDGERSYAVASACDGTSIKGTITFSLAKSRSVWQEDRWPEATDVVLLSDLRRKVRGWRAMSARFVHLSDEV
jgi:hypothetical protein